MILVLDYGMSNLRSVSKALEKLGSRVTVSDQVSDIEKAEKIVLPGVGAFGDAMKELETRQLAEPLKSFMRSGRPFLGICLGLQLLFDSSDESPAVRGLGVLPGKVSRFIPSVEFKVPHMGWNQLGIRKPDCGLLRGVNNGAFVYFVHSYYAIPQSQDIVLADCDYSSRFTAMIWKDNIYGCQFHPEKSQETGLRILENFVNL